MIKYNITPLQYSVNKYGTEQILPENTNSTHTCAPVMNIAYGDNSPVQQDSMYRKSGGTEDIETGTAKIENIKGNTVVWNQKCDTRNFSNTTHRNITYVKQSNGAVEVNGTASGNSVNFYNFPFIQGHVYYIPNKTADLNYGTSANNDTTWNVGAFNLFTATTQNIIMVYAGNGTTVNNVKIFPMLFDLTLIYGAGNEPTSVAQFEADYLKWFGKPLGYEPYNEGELIPVKMTGVKTTGFNIFNKTEIDNRTAIMAASGATTNNQILFATHYIKVIQNNTYRFSEGFAIGSGYYGIAYYDDNKNYISGVVTNELNVSFSRTIPNGVSYIRICGRTTYIDTCIINISDTSKNGTYEPYEEHTVSFDVTTLQGKLNGEGGLVTPFADGLKKAGSVQDEIYCSGNKIYGVKRVDSVDLGTLNWNIDNQGTFYVNVAGMHSTTTGEIDYINAKYKYDSVPVSVTLANIQDKHIRRVGDFIGIKDNSYPNTSDFKSAMNGVMLYYELAEPLVYELDITPQDLQKRYIGNTPVGRVYKGDTLLWEANNQ